MRIKSHHHHHPHQREEPSNEDEETDDRQQGRIPDVIRNRWSVQRPISSGSFGYIYQGTDLITHEKVAIKFEAIIAHHPQLARESQIYRSVEGAGMPKMYWYGFFD